MSSEHMSGGTIIAIALARAGVRSIFTLCGGHISPILVEGKKQGIRVVDLRDEKAAVFAADAAARMTGVVGVAAVTAGPGVTNTVTAVKNAQMAESPLLVIGGATPTVLQGRGSLQDIDQLSLMEPITKWATSVKLLSDLKPTIEEAIRVAQKGVPGPVFIEIPVDLLYPEEIVRSWYMEQSGVEGSSSLEARALGLYLRGHLYRQFNAPHIPLKLPFPELHLRPRRRGLEEVAEKLRSAERPVLVAGSQTVAGVRDPDELAQAISRLGIPTYLAGSARGLLGRTSQIQFRHQRGKALKEADLVIVTGFPFDFRLGYGRSISKRATLVAANLSRESLTKNRRPDLAFEMHPGEFLVELAGLSSHQSERYGSFIERLRERETARDREIEEQGTAASTPGRINPISFFLRLEQKLADDSVLVVDGGDFVATAAYILRPRSPLSWLDPGVFGTLGVGGGFAVGAGVCRPKSEVWLIYGDGSSAYSLSEIDTCVRHGLAPIAVIGNDAAWAQIAREQVEVLGDDVGTVLRHTDYHRVAEGYGGVGLLLDDPSRIDPVLDEAKHHARAGRPVCINVQIAKSEFRKGSISM